MNQSPSNNLTRAFLAALVGVSLGGSLALAQQAEQEAIEAGRETLTGQRYNWYDPAADDVRPLDVEPPEEPADWSWLWAWMDWLPDWDFTMDLGYGAFSISFLEVLFWIFLAVLLGLIAYLVSKLLRTQDHKLPVGQPEAVVQEAVSLADRVEALPVQVNRDVGDLLAEARRHYEAGNYQEAIIYLYSHQLLLLDKYHIIRLAKGKTNRQYLREVLRNGRDALGKMLEQSLVTFEDVFFGDHAIDRVRFETCWANLPQFERLLQEGRA